MPQSLAQNYVHIVFSTKHRQPFLKDHEIRREMQMYLAGVCKNKKLALVNRWRRWGSCARSLPPFEIDFDWRFHPRFEARIIEMDQNQRNGLSRFLLAERIWRIFDQSVACKKSNTLHSKSERASQKNIVSGRISPDIKKIRVGMGRAIRVGLAFRSANELFNPFGVGGMVYVGPRVVGLEIQARLPWALS